MLILFFALAIAAVTDTATREIPVWLFPAALCLCLLWWLYTGTMPAADNFIGAAVLFFPTLILCLTGKMGGGDLIMFTVAGFILGFHVLPVYMFWIGFVSLALVSFTKIFYVAQHRNERVMDKEIPIAPVAMAAYLLLLVGGRICIL